jgi:hypothetical protein
LEIVLAYALEGGAIGYLTGVIVIIILALIVGPGDGFSGGLAALALFFAIPFGTVGLVVGMVVGIIRRFKQRGGKHDHEISVAEDRV